MHKNTMDSFCKQPLISWPRQVRPSLAERNQLCLEAVVQVLVGSWHQLPDPLPAVQLLLRCAGEAPTIESSWIFPG